MKKRQVKRYGNTIVIKLSPSDLEDLDLKINDYVDIEDVVKINKYKKLPTNDNNLELLKKIKKKVKK